MTPEKFRLNISIRLVFLFLLLCGTVHSQTATLSPYSRYGIGELLFNGFSHQRAMGGIAIGLRQPAYLNFGNPASYAADSIVLFELGVSGEATNFANKSVSSNKTNANVSYLSMGFPLIKNYWYLNIGMLPYSASGYKIQQATTVTYPGNARFIYEGEGGYNRFYTGTGFKISNKFSAGLNASYLFGSASHTSRVEFSESGYINTLLKSTVSLSDLFIDGGLQYSTLTKKGLQFTIGISGAPATDIRAKRDLAWVNYIINAGFYNYKDTALFIEKERGDVKLPMQAGIGFSLSNKDNWLIGADLKLQQWEDFESYGVNDSLKNSYKINVGGQWVPDHTSIKYFGRAAYRAGLYYSTGYLELKNESINDFGITLGAGLPLRGKPYFSNLDIAFELGQRGTINENLVRERYGRIVIGLTLREDWFRKPKFD